MTIKNIKVGSWESQYVCGKNKEDPIYIVTALQGKEITYFSTTSLHMTKSETFMTVFNAKGYVTDVSSAKPQNVASGKNNYT